MTINELRDLCHQRAVEKGFVNEQSIRGMIVSIALMITELVEAIEAVRSNNYQDFNVGWQKDTMEDELADTVIRIMDFCGAHGIDIGWQIEKKLEYNLQRPYRHGKEV